MKLELVRFVEDGMDDDAMVLNSAEHYGAAVISNDNFSQSKYIVYKEARRRVIKYCFKRTTIPPDEYYKPENIVDMFTNLTFLDFEKRKCF
jgi:hypothetical protein